MTIRFRAFFGNLKRIVTFELTKTKEREKAHGHNESASPQASFTETGKEYGSGAASQSAEARRLHTRVHHDTEEAELSDAQGRARASHQWL